MTASQTMSGRSTVVGVFRDRDRAEQAVEELKRAGFRDDEIGFITRRNGDTSGAATTADTDVDRGTDHSAGAATGAVAGGVLGAIIGAGAALLIPGVGPVLAGGILASALGGAAIGAAAGGIIGALTGLGIPEEEATYYNEEFTSGRTIVTVKAGNRYQQAYDILHRFGAYDYSGREAAMSDTDSTRTTRTAATTGATSAAAMRTGTMQTQGQVQGNERELRVPEVEERLEVEKRPVQQGEVRIEREVHEEQKSVPVTLSQEEVHVEKRDVPERPLRAGEEAFQEGTIRVPVRGEEAVARKEAVVTGEVVVNKERSTETQQVADTVRRTEVHVDKSGETVHPAGQEVVSATSGRWEEAMPRYRGYWQSRYGTSGGRWEEAEPSYRYGWEMRNDARYKGRNFDEVESDLQKDWAQRYPSTPWEKAKAYVRESWTDMKSAV